MIKIIGAVLIGIFLHPNGFSQDRNWKIQQSKDGKVTVKSEVVDGKDERGDNIKIMHYVAQRTGKLSLSEAENYLRDSENYIDIWESTLETRELKKGFRRRMD